jgi:hypothetical protein
MALDADSGQLRHVSSPPSPRFLAARHLRLYTIIQYYGSVGEDEEEKKSMPNVLKPADRRRNEVRTI